MIFVFTKVTPFERNYKLVFSAPPAKAFAFFSAQSAASPQRLAGGI
jgi:hypothetical protein